ncbi:MULTISPECIES: hypothetical protein [unclassified Microcoleus]|nr:MULTISPECIES: hypothetical protein [unclassified Microcoleus]
MVECLLALWATIGQEGESLMWLNPYGMVKCSTEDASNLTSNE